ncbi:hypothetical protein [Amorphus sp. 3PC139-8]|uniref:hypothetical protein n=1 Tax=Amorphus sp. 3PC139-8 TaxID=2735676 RepID=UPI00345C6B15
MSTLRAPRPRLRFSAYAWVGLALFAPIAPAAADPLYPVAAVDTSVLHPVPDSVRAFAATIVDLSFDGRLDAGASADPDPELDGLSPKAFLLSRVSPEFVCDRDFGGLCGASGPLAPIYDFLRIWLLENDREIPDFIYEERYDTIDAMPLDVLDLSLSDAFLPLLGGDLFFRPAPYSAIPKYDRQLSSGRTLATATELCFPSIVPIAGGTDELQIAHAIAGGGYELMVASYLYGVGGSEEEAAPLRALPKPSAPVTNTIGEAVVFVPGADVIETLMPRGDLTGWVYVVPPEGPGGFLDISASGLHPVSPVGQPQICYSVGDTVRFSAHVAAGD